MAVFLPYVSVATFEGIGIFKEGRAGILPAADGNLPELGQGMPPLPLKRVTLKFPPRRIR